MLKNADAETLMQDAHAMHAAAVRTLAAGDWRDAAEKGWLAARNATAALVLETTGVHNPHSTRINAGLRQLARRGSSWAELRRRYGDFAHHLHSEAFYGGVYNDDIGNILQDVADYLRRVAELAET